MASRIRRWRAHLFLNIRQRRTSMPWLRGRLVRRAVWLTYVLLLLQERPPFVPLPSWWYLQVTRHIDQIVTKSAIYPRDCLPYFYGRVLADACSLFLNLHNTGFFPDYNLLSVTDGSIWIPYLARHSEIFKKPNFQVVHRFFWSLASFFGCFLRSDIPFFSFFPHFFLNQTKFSASPGCLESEYRSFMFLFLPDLRLDNDNEVRSQKEEEKEPRSKMTPLKRTKSVGLWSNSCGAPRLRG